VVPDDRACDLRIPAAVSTCFRDWIRRLSRFFAMQSITFFCSASVSVFPLAFAHCLFRPCKDCVCFFGIVRIKPAGIICDFLVLTESVFPCISTDVCAYIWTRTMAAICAAIVNNGAAGTAHDRASRRNIPTTIGIRIRGMTGTISGGSMSQPAWIFIWDLRHIRMLVCACLSMLR